MREDSSLDMAAAKRDARLLFQLCAAGVDEDAPELKAVLERIDEAVQLMTPAQVRFFNHYTKLLETCADDEDLAP